MKRGIKIFGIIALVLGVIFFVKAQTNHGKFGHHMRGENHHKGMLGLDLSDEQKEQMKDLRVAFMADTKDEKNALNEKRAKLRTLTTVDKVNANAVNGLVDEMASIRATITKKRLANMQKVRSILTEEQRTMFDAKSGKMRHHRGEGFDHEMRRGPRGLKDVD